jgi:hypothetical protein
MIGTNQFPKPPIITGITMKKIIKKACAVIKTAQTIKGNLCIVIPGALILKIVVMKLIAPKMEEAPDK